VRQSEADYLRLQKELSAEKIRGSYLFAGSEDFLMDEAVDLICDRLLPADQRASGLFRTDGREHTLEQVLDLAGTVSLFASSRVVVVPEAPYFSGEQALKDTSMERLLQPDTADKPDSVVVFFAQGVAKNNRNYKRLASAGAVYHFQPLKPAELFNWLRTRLSANGKAARQETLTLLVERVGRDLRRLASELDKLVAYLGNERELDEKSVLMATSRSLQGDIFAMTDAVIFGRTAKALTQLQDLLSSGEPPLRILAMLVRQFRLLGESLELMDAGCAPSELAARLSLHPYAAEVLARQVRQTEHSWLATCVDLLLQADLDIKRGRANQKLVLETLVIALGKTQKSA